MICWGRSISRSYLQKDDREKGRKETGEEGEGQREGRRNGGELSKAKGKTTGLRDLTIVQRLGLCASNAGDTGSIPH